MSLALYCLFKNSQCILRWELYLIDCAQTDDQKYLLAVVKSLVSSLLAARTSLWRIFGLKKISAEELLGLKGIMDCFPKAFRVGILIYLSCLGPHNPSIILSSCVLGSLMKHFAPGSSVGTLEWQGVQ